MIFIGFLSIILGLIFGSFLSAYSFRFPKNISIMKGRSFCPNCKKMISWFDNIPLLSFLLLRGRCRSCKKPISIRYPLIEFSTALGFFLIFFRFYPDYLTISYYLLIFCLLVLIFVIDFEHRLIPDTFVFWGIIIAALFTLLTAPDLFFPSILAGLLASSLLMFIYLLTHGRGMGLGDVKFAVLGGVVSGLNFFLIWLFVSFLTGGITGIILILAKKAKLKDQIAFGPFLVFGLVVTILFGNSLLKIFGF